MAELSKRPEDMRTFMESLEFDGDATEDEVQPRNAPMGAA